MSKKEKTTVKKEKTTAKGASFKTKAFRAGGYSTAAAAIIIIIAVLINLLASNISTAYTNIDTTDSGVYSISEQTKDMVSSLENDVTIYYIASPDSRMGYITKLLDKYKSCGKHLKVEYIDPDVNPDFASEYTDESVANGDLLVVCGEKSQVVSSADMIEYEAGSYEYYVYYAQNGQQTDVYWNGEIQLTKAIDFVTSDKTYSVYFFDYSGDISFETLESALENENIVCVTLPEDSDEIPDDASCVILSDVYDDISESDLTLLRNYLNKGGKLYIAASYSGEERENLTKLLADYGLSFTDATLEDGDRYFSSKEQLAPLCTGDHAIIAPFSKADYIYFSSAMGIKTEETGGVTVTPLITTSDSAYLSTDDSDDVDFTAFNLGVIAENSDTNAQIVVYGTSDYTSSDYMSASDLSNSDLFVNSIGWLCDKDSAVTIHAKAVTSDTTLDFSEGSAGVIVVLTAVVPAVCAVAAGFIIWYRRKNS